jgi:Fe-S cluster assembly protein SufD
MTAATTRACVEALLAGSRDLPATPLAWLNERRGLALERANALSVPTTRDEEWRFTDITPLTRMRFRSPVTCPRPAMSEASRFIVPEATVHLTFVDGAFAPELSAASGLPYGVVAAPLSAVLATHEAVIEPHLARHARFDRDLFAALNTAHLRDGAFVWIAKNQKCPTPVQLLFISTQPECVAYPRALIVVEAGAECTVVEDYVALTESAYFTNAVTEVAVGASARVEHVKLQREAQAAFHIANCSVALAHDASYFSSTVTLGARISRHNLVAVQQGEGTSCRIDGLALISGRQLADTHSTIDHAQPNGRSRQLHKCIVDGAAHAVFNGRILVRPGAQLTDSAQESRNLLLSPKASVDAKPQLEIFADDVKCAHGATVGQLDAEQVFYLKSRGLSEARARSLLTYAFGAELIDRIPVASLVESLERTVLERTHAGATEGGLSS